MIFQRDFGKYWQCQVNFKFQQFLRRKSFCMDALGNLIIFLIRVKQPNNNQSNKNNSISNKIQYKYKQKYYYFKCINIA